VLVDKQSLEMAVEVDARWEPMGAQEYYDYWHAMYSTRSNKWPLVMAEDAAARWSLEIYKYWC
jgi:hypothetical protein